MRNVDWAKVVKTVVKILYYVLCGGVGMMIGSSCSNFLS